jgi:hypothetical protein
MATGEACDCSGSLCTDAEFCYYGFCNTSGKGNNNITIECSVLAKNQIYFFNFRCSCCISTYSISGAFATGESCHCTENFCADAQFYLVKLYI